MNYSPKQGVRSHGLPHDPFKSSTVPRPIGWDLYCIERWER